MAFVISGVAIGALCAFFRHRALIMLPVGALLTVGAVVSGVIFHAHPWVIATEVFGSIAASQFTYVAVSLTHHLVRSRGLMIADPSSNRQLSAQLEAPRSLPPELSALVGCMPRFGFANLKRVPGQM
jgi:hypothetical protein